MPKPDSAYVCCIHCERGYYGDRSCSAGAFHTKGKSGCFNGIRMEILYPSYNAAADAGKKMFDHCSEFFVSTITEGIKTWFVPVGERSRDKQIVGRYLRAPGKPWRQPLGQVSEKINQNNLF